MATTKAGFASGLVFTPPLVAQWMPRPVVVDITPASVSGSGVAEETYTVSGATTKDAVFVSPSDITAGVGAAYARVTAADTVAIGWVNATAGALTPAAGAYKFILIKAQE